jgi:hypothetical protein
MKYAKDNLLLKTQKNRNVSHFSSTSFNPQVSLTLKLNKLECLFLDTLFILVKCLRLKHTYAL